MVIQINLGERLVRLADRVLSSDTNQTIGQTGGITVSTATDTTVPTTKAVKEYVDNHIKVKQLQSGDNIDTLFEQGFYWINSNPDAINVDGTFPITDEKYAYAISVDGGNKVIRQIATVYKGQGTRTFVRMYSGHTSNLGWGEWKEMSFTDHLHGNISSDGKIGTTANLPVITATNGALTTGSFGTSANTFCQGNDNRLSDDRNPISHAINDTRYGAASSTNYGHIRVMNNLTSTGTTDALSANQGKELKALVDTKVPITDIKDNLTSSDANKPLSAKQGKALKSLADSKLAKSDTDYILVYDVFVEDDCCKDRWERWGQYQETLTVTNTTITVPANRMAEYMGGACYSNTFQDDNSIDDSSIIYPFAIPSGIEITITLTNAVDAYISKDQETVFMNSNKILQNTATTFNLDEGENLYIYVRDNATFNYTIKKYKAETINSIANIIYPIGSIYMSVNNTSPETLFGGRWEQLTDRFLLGAGHSYTNGSTGGSKDAVVVSHKHRPSNTSLNFVSSKDDVQLNSIKRAIPSQNSSGWYFVHAGQYTDGIADLNYTETVGESGTNKNMPPYLAVCIWKRTQ